MSKSVDNVALAIECATPIGSQAAKKAARPAMLAMITDLLEFDPALGPLLEEYKRRAGL